MARGQDARQAELESHTRKQLLAIAKKMGITGRHTMTKDKLVTVIMQQEGTQEASRKPRRTATQPKKTAAAPAGRRPKPKTAGEVMEQEQRVEQAKYDIGLGAPPEEFAPQELPEAYGQDRISLLARDPYWAYSYWEVTPETHELAMAELGDEHHGAATVLRVYDMHDGEPRQRYDIQLPPNTNNWYLNLGEPGGSFCVDIGILTLSGKFYTLARSNAVTMPPAGASDVVDEQWMVLQQQFERLYALSGGFNPGSSSAELKQMFEKRFREELASGAISSLMSPVRKERHRGFWFVVDAELIVYGATEPDATVTCQGKPVRLRPDGTFTLRFALPDGKQVIDLTAVSADKKEARTITPVVERQTQRPEPVLSE